jgi:glycerol uptake facilitator-like aquaporin
MIGTLLILLGCGAIVLSSALDGNPTFERWLGVSILFCVGVILLYAGGDMLNG